MLEFTECDFGRDGSIPPHCVTTPQNVWSLATLVNWFFALLIQESYKSVSECGEAWGYQPFLAADENSALQRVLLFWGLDLTQSAIQKVNPLKYVLSPLSSARTLHAGYWFCCPAYFSILHMWWELWRSTFPINWNMHCACLGRGRLPMYTGARREPWWGDFSREIKIHVAVLCWHVSV